MLEWQKLARNSREHTFYDAREGIYRAVNLRNRWPPLPVRIRTRRSPRFRGFLDYVPPRDALNVPVHYEPRKRERGEKRSHCYSRAAAGNGNSRLSTRHGEYPRISSVFRVIHTFTQRYGRKMLKILQYRSIFLSFSLFNYENHKLQI